MIKTILFLVCFILVAGCASDPNSFMRSPSAITANIKSLEGKTVEEAIAKLGFPQGEQIIMGKKVLVWFNSDKSVSSHGRMYYTSDGVINISAISREFKCVVRGIVSDGKIQQIEIQANSVYYCPGQRR